MSRKNTWYAAAFLLLGALGQTAGAQQMSTADSTMMCSTMGDTIFAAHTVTSGCVGAGLYVNAAMVDSVQVTAFLRNGTQVRSTKRAQIDAVFLSEGATRRFLLNYYERTGQTRKAAALRRRLRHAVTPKTK